MSLPVLPQDTALTGAAAGAWAVGICAALKAPVTTANIYTFAGWFHNEGGGGQNNPMNSTLGSEYPAINSDGVRNYPTPEIGVTQTAATLENGYYPEIVAAFRAGVGLGDPSPGAAAELRTWSGGGYSSITPIIVPFPTPPATEDVMAVAATVGPDGKVHVFQETSDGTVYGSTQVSPGGAFAAPFVVMKNGKQVK